MTDVQQLQNQMMERIVQAIALFEAQSDHEVGLLAIMSASGQRHVRLMLNKKQRVLVVPPGALPGGTSGH